MQARKAQWLREDWGDKPCEHPDYDKEYYLGADTGDLVCTQCGEILTREQVKQIDLRKESENS